MVLARGLLSLGMDTTMEATVTSMSPGPTLTMESVFIMVLARGLLSPLTTMAVPILSPMSLGPTTLMATVCATLESDLLNPLTTMEDMATVISMYPGLTLIMVSVCIMVLARGLLSLGMDTTMEATVTSMSPGPTLTMESVF